MNPSAHRMVSVRGISVSNCAKASIKELRLPVRFMVVKGKVFFVDLGTSVAYFKQHRLPVDQDLVLVPGLRLVIVLPDVPPGQEADGKSCLGEKRSDRLDDIKQSVKIKHNSNSLKFPSLFNSNLIVFSFHKNITFFILLFATTFLLRKWSCNLSPSKKKMYNINIHIIINNLNNFTNSNHVWAA